MDLGLIELKRLGHYRYCLMLIDAFLKWVEIVPEKHPDAQWQKHHVNILFLSMVFHRSFGVTMQVIFYK